MRKIPRAQSTKDPTTRKMQTAPRDQNAFVLLDLVFAIILLGILGMSAWRSSFVQERLCTTKLAQKLQGLQNDLSAIFTKQYFHAQTPALSAEQFAQIFLPYTKGNTKACALTLQKSTLLALNHKQSTFFYISSSALFPRPQIRCSFENQLCKKIHNRLAPL
ncbi:hypothetical protein [Helicobacter mustelae]|uniref:hypothetical protein n=2 Tax=Helicobacter mustelae TaxID=217 RepID=UPI0015F04C10|nr:hypothetical protein [Helicobacter mustelae]